MTSRKSSRNIAPNLANIMSELHEVIAEIAGAAEAALHTEAIDPQAKKAAERMLRGSARGRAVLEALRSSEEK